MIVWGGYDGHDYRGDGSRFDPAANTWKALSAKGAPSPRADHTAVFTGKEMIVWGGFGPVDARRTRVSGGGAHLEARVTGDETYYLALADGGAYDPAADTWR